MMIRSKTKKKSEAKTEKKLILTLPHISFRVGLAYLYVAGILASRSGADCTRRALCRNTNSYTGGRGEKINFNEPLAGCQPITCFTINIPRKALHIIFLAYYFVRL